MNVPQKIVIAVSGASGSIYAKLIIDRLMTIQNCYQSLSLVFSDTAMSIWKDELGQLNIEKYPFAIYKNDDFYAPIASGSSKFDTMIIIPCSMGSLSRIANGYSNDLISRAADVILKEGRNLILVPREAPYNLIHIENMKKLMLAGAKICPASPSFYSKPKSIKELAGTIVDRVLDLAGFDIDTYRWGTNKK